MRDKFSAIVTAGFALFLGALLVLHIALPDRAFSDEENRALQQMPQLTVDSLLDTSFMTSFSDYLADQFPLRQGWISAKAYAQRVTGRRENNGIYFANDETLIAGFQVEDTGLVDRNIDYVNLFARESSVPVLVSLIPNAAYTWSDKLPYGAPVDDQYVMMSRMLENESYYSTNAVLAAHKSEPIYYRTDHHWTSLGAYYGYTALVEALGLTPLDITAYTPFAITHDFYGTNHAKSAATWIEADAIDIYVPEEFPGQLYDESKLNGRDKYAYFLGGNASVRVVETEQTDKPRLLLVRDSHADALVPFLIEHFSEIHLIDLRYYKQSVHDYIEAEGIDAVVILYGVSNFAEDTNLFVLTME